MKRHLISKLSTGVVLFAATPLPGGVLKIELPPETAVFKPGPGVDIANGRCLTCHSVEYVASQPPEPLAFWTAEVKKMRDKYGADIPDEQAAPVANYLVRHYGLDTNTAPAELSAKPAPSPAPETALGGEALATKYGCLTCHGVDKKIVGPAYKDVAAKYRNDPAAYAKISDQIHKGGTGKWGPAIMPPYSTLVTDDETRTLAAWILSR
jgi:sulfite dehydrogenase